MYDEDNGVSALELTKGDKFLFLGGTSALLVFKECNDKDELVFDICREDGVRKTLPFDKDSWNKLQPIIFPICDVANDSIDKESIEKLLDGELNKVAEQIQKFMGDSKLERQDDNSGSRVRKDDNNSK